MNKTSISWTQSDDGKEGSTWNPTFGCEVVSPGCSNCYAMRMAGRFSGPGKPYEGLVRITKNKRAVWNGHGFLSPSALTKPLTWAAPRRVFVNSMSDLFFDKFSNQDIAAVFGVMAACPQHTFQILTKRPERMLEWFKWMDCALPLKPSHFPYEPRPLACWDFAKIVIRETGAAIDSSVWDSEFMQHGHLVPWPLPNVWLGVSTENQETAEERIPQLLYTPAVVRFISAEPLLGPLDLTKICSFKGDPLSALDEIVGHVERPPLDWVIVGCESGPGARPCDYRWLRSIRDQCKRAGVPMFLKQARCALEEGPGITTGAIRRATNFVVSGGEGSRRKAGGVFDLPYLDGVQHKAFPVVSHG